MKFNLRYKAISIIFMIALIQGCCGAASPTTGGSTSTAGSTAAMLPYKNVLYYLNGNQLNVLDTSNPAQPSALTTLTASSAETLFIHDEHLYIGGAWGVDIFDITDPATPVNVSFYQHLRGCDPFVADGDYGYVTIRNQFTCFGNANRLEVLDITDPESPTQITTHNMNYPWGLAKLPEHLAVCEESYGLALLEINFTEGTPAPAIQEATRYSQIQCFDLIYNDGNLITTANDGIYQFSVSGEYLVELSRIPVEATTQISPSASLF